MSLSVLVAIAVLALLAYWTVRRRGGAEKRVSADTTPALDAWIREALELELASGALDMTASTTHERARLARSLRGEPDADVVTKIEQRVKTVELDYLRYAHEKDVEVTLTVRYEDGRAGKAQRRVDWADVPDTIRSDFDAKATSRVFRTWTFPWQRMSAL